MSHAQGPVLPGGTVHHFQTQSPLYIQSPLHFILSQVLSTLLENSLAHGRGTVDVHARRSGPSVVVEVR